MKKSVALLVLTSALLVGCRRGVLPTSSEQSITSDTPTSVTSQTPATSSNPTSGTTATTSVTPTNSTTHTTSSTNTTSSHSTTTSEGGEREGEWFDEHYYYSDLGYYAMGAPKNADSPINLKTTLSADESSWFNYEFDTETEELDNFRYIYKNSCDDGVSGHKCGADWFNNDKGGLKFDQVATGFGSPKFTHTGEKLEIRIGISQLINNSETPKKNKDTAYVYFFDASDNYLGKYTIEEGTITSSTQQVRFYWTTNAASVAYFEFRINALPYKNSQCYNLGVGYCNFKSWERA